MGVGYGERQSSARHTPLMQSLASIHVAVSAQPGQPPLPPQSTSLSSPFFRPSAQPAGSGGVVGADVGAMVDVKMWVVLVAPMTVLL